MNSNTNERKYARYVPSFNALERCILSRNVSFPVSNRTPVLHLKPINKLVRDVKGARHKMGIPCTNTCQAEVKMHVLRLGGGC